MIMQTPILQRKIVIGFITLVNTHGAQDRLKGSGSELGPPGSEGGVDDLGLCSMHL